MSTCSELIIKATGASGDDIATIDNIMREELFHSPPDWQTARQIASAARKAQAMLRADYEFDHIVHGDLRLAFKESTLERSLNQPTTGSPSELDLRITRQSSDRFSEQAFSPA
jgi:hypothetical protein